MALAARLSWPRQQIRGLVWPRTEASSPGWADRIAALAGAVALVAIVGGGLAGPASVRDHVARIEHEDQREAQLARRAAMAEEVRYRGGETLTAAYGGAQFTYPSDVRISRPGTELTAHKVDWEGRPFEHPVYYGLRVQRWMPMSSLGAMVDFTHSKVYSPMEQPHRFSGTKQGKPVAQSARLEEVFHKLEFTHGHNMLTLNGLWRLPFPNAFLSPYVGGGFGVSLPHTEVQLTEEGERTYEYQYTGPAFQLVGGFEFRIPRLSYFVEYKFTVASYRAPLHHRDGKTVFQDLAYQLSRWWSGKEPELGWATTRLTSHQVISGMGYRTTPTIAP